jgi:hypothetical protein
VAHLSCDEYLSGLDGVLRPTASRQAPTRTRVIDRHSARRSACWWSCAAGGAFGLRVGARRSFLLLDDAGVRPDGLPAACTPHKYIGEPNEDVVTGARKLADTNLRSSAPGLDAHELDPYPGLQHGDYRYGED